MVGFLGEPMRKPIGGRFCCKKRRQEGRGSLAWISGN